MNRHVFDKNGKVKFANLDKNGLKKLKIDIELHNRDCASGDEKILLDLEVTDNEANVFKFDTGENIVREKTDVEKLTDGIFNLDNYKERKKEQIKAIARVHIEEALPDYKQRNIANDGEAGTIRFAEETNDTYSGVTQKITPKIDNSNNDHESLETIYNNPDSVNITDIISVLDPAVQPYATVYTQMKLRSLAAYLLVKDIRDWSNSKEAQVDSAIDQAGVDAVDITDCPELHISN